MSIFDEERKRLGVAPIGNSQQKSIFDEERRRMAGEVQTYSIDPLPLAPIKPIETQEPGKPGFLDILKTNALRLSDAVIEPVKELINPGSVNTKTMKTPSGNAVPGQDIPVVGTVMRGLEAIGTDPTLNKIGELGRTFYTPGAGLPNVAGLTGAAESAVSKVLPGLGQSLGGKVAKTAMTEAITGAPLGAGQYLASGGTDLGDAAKNAGYGALLGGGLGGLAPLAGAGLRKLAGPTTELLSDKAPIQPLGLPEPRSERLRKLSEGNVLDANFEPIYAQGDTVYSNPTSMADNFGLPASARYEEIQRIREGMKRALPEPRNMEAIRRSQGTVLEPGTKPIYAQGDIYQPPVLGLPEPNVLPPTTARLERRANPYKQKFEQLIAEAQKLDLPPGREREYLDDLWSRMAGPTDPNLDELITLAYPERASRLTPDAVQRARIQQQQRDVYGVPSLVKTMDDRYQSYVGEAFAPTQKVGAKKPKKKNLGKPQPNDIVPQPIQETSEQTVQRLGVQRTFLDDMKRINELEKPIIGIAPLPETKLGIKPIEPEILDIRPKRGRVEPVGLPFKEVAATAERELPSSILPTVEQMEARATETPFGDAELLRDISGFSAQTRDFYRNMEAVLGKDRAARYIEPFNAAKKTNIEEQETWLNRLKSEVVDKLGIDKGSKLSALVQKFGEKQISLDELKAAAPQDWQKVVEADQWFRKAYDSLIDRVNESRAKIYPTNPDKIVPKRQDYYRHFQELNGLEGLKNLFDSPSQISPSLAGISEFVTPKSKWAGFMQRRGLGPFKNDAVGGFLNYLPSASYAIHIDPQIPVMRTLGKELAEATEKSKNLNGFIEYLNDFSNDLAGKTNSADRFIQKIIPGGRKTMAAVQWLNNRVKANTILGNVGSTLAQLANIPNGVAFAKQYAIKGAGETLKAPFVKNSVMEQSGFLKERYAGKLYRQFDNRWIDQPQKFAEWMMETADRVGTYFVWNSAYAKGAAEGAKNPIAFADDATRKLIAGRGIGEVPLLQKSKLVQIVAPFQLEVANLWRVMGDFVKNKDAGAVLTLFVANYIFNRGMEQIKGSGVTFDPIQALIEASAEDLSPVQRAGRVGGEVLSNLPLGQTVASLAPQYGGSLLGIQLPTRKELFGDNDPTRFGSGLVAANGLTDPLSKAILPFGGNQLKKTVEGTQAALKGGAYTKDGELKFPVDISPLTTAQMLLFGPNSTSAAREYYNNDRRPLSAKDTEQFQQSFNPNQFYGDKMKQREVDKIERKITEIRKNDTMKESDKQKEYNKLLEKLRKAANGG